jgi:hypothetical protein
MIGILFRGKVEKHADTGWEPFREYDPNNPEPEPEPEFDPKLAQEWAQIIRLAKRNGFTVEYTLEGLYMERGKSNGTFKEPRGGLEMAKKFLRHHI